MAIFKNSSVDIYYEVAGDGSGPWVTLVNGHTRASSDFRQFVRFLVSHNFRIMTFDNRGCGQTVAAKPFALADIADDIVALHEHEGITSAHLLGISMGGLICQSFAQRYPRRTLSLTLVSTAANPALIRTDDSDWPKTEAGVAERLQTYFAPDFVRRNEALIQMMAKQMLKNLTEGGLQEGARLQRQAIRSFAPIELSEIEAASLVVHGALDQVIPASEAKALAEQLKNSRLELLEGCGHLILAEMPKRLYELAAGFFDAVGGENV